MTNRECNKCIHYEVCCDWTSKEALDAAYEAVNEGVCKDCDHFNPTADVVEAVRCKDCKFWGIPHANDVEKSHYCCRDNMWCMPLRFADDFCSYGERSENEES